MTNSSKERHWVGDVPVVDDFGDPIEGMFIDGKTKVGPWAIMTPRSHKMNGVGLGTGRGQRYLKTPADRWLKVEG
jgi:hypothetical protein